jgi:hypothetical protein
MARDLPKSAGYEYGLEAGFHVYELCVVLGIRNLDLNTVISFGGKGVTQTRRVSG